MTTQEQFKSWLTQEEGLNLEFKKAENQFSTDKDLPDYCAALSNEGGGKLILGVADKKPRELIGTKAFSGTHHTLSNILLNKLGIRIDVEELFYQEKRILIFHVPSHTIGSPIRSSGNYTYPMRAGESLTEMDPQTLRKILTEGEPDFSRSIVSELTLNDLDKEAISNFRKHWIKKANRDEYLNFSDEKILNSIGVYFDKRLTYAALILFGRKEKIDKLLPASEIIFEWRNDAAKTAHDFRINWREPFFKIYDEIWNTINARNTRTPFQEGLFQREIYSFNEKAIREALLNAVTHRDYTINSRSIFIKASPQKFFIESPGGFPNGITPENILEKSSWRNRTIAEVFEKAGLVERAGQGMNDIFDSTIREGKGVPDFRGTDPYSVVLNIPAQVKDKNFILFLERVGQEKQIIFTFEEIYELEKIREHQKIQDIEFKDKFLEIGIIEKVGHTKGAKYILSHKYFSYEQKPGVYTRLTDISREKKKELILQHLRKNKKGYLKDFKDVFPELKTGDISNLLTELKRDKQIIFNLLDGSTKKGWWELLK